MKIFKTPNLIVKLAWSNFYTQYSKSYIGAIWSIIHPLTTVIIFWFVFTQAFKVQPDKGGHPFIIWLLAGMSIWLFFAEAITTSTTAISSNAFLLKKRTFNIILLPYIKIISSLFSHLTFMLLVISMYLFYNIYPTMYWIQIPYYILCTICISIGISMITSSISVFIPDIENVVSVFIQLFFWVTPVFWSLYMIPNDFRNILKFNPIAYLVQGYRDSLLSQGWLWDHKVESFAFWAFTFIIMIIGHMIFNRLKPHFADVL